MTKKDFQLIAAVLSDLTLIPAKTQEEWRIQRTMIAEEFADALAETNPLFKRDLFIQAATGVVAVTARKARQFAPGEKNPGGRDDASYVEG